MTGSGWITAGDAARAVAHGDVSATTLVDAALERIARRNPVLNAFAAVLAERARTRAAALDRARETGRPVGPLAGVPFAVKNLFDVAGLATLAGSAINRDRPTASVDATLIERLERAGAILVGTLGMGEYAYDFTGENSHYGPTRNPHDPSRMSGGSSGGSGVAVAAGMVPLSLGSDTNGSIRVPAAFCGLFGLKPTYGRLSRAGTFPFVASLDCLGPLARCTEDLAIAYDAMSGHDPRDPVCQDRPAEPVFPALREGAGGLRVAVAGGYFSRGACPEALAAVAACAAVAGDVRELELPEVARARAAGYVVTASEAAALHLARLQNRSGDFDPAVRDRLIAGALLPASLVQQAQKFRRWFREAVLPLFM
jgi:AtzE family amidohydrolase